MASSWGCSWLRAWGNSWGDTSACSVEPAAVQQGGGGYAWFFREYSKPVTRDEREVVEEVASEALERLEAARKEAQAEHREFVVAEGALAELQSLLAERDIALNGRLAEIVRALMIAQMERRAALYALGEAQAEARQIAELIRQQQIVILRNNENAKRVLMLLSLQ